MNEPKAGLIVIKSAPLQPNALKGILLAACGLLLFACMDGATKYLVTHYNVPFVVAMRYITQCLLMVIVLAPRHAGHLVKTQRTRLVLLRALALSTASLCVGLAFQRMPLAETTAIGFIGPIIVVLLAKPLLGEQIGGLGWIAVVTGFLGVMLIARPGSGLAFSGIVFALLAVSANVVYQLLSRVLASTEKAVTLLFYTAMVGSIFYGIALPWFWEDKIPSTLELVLFLGMGLAGGLGHYLFTLAYHYAPASLLAPVTYVQLLWAGLIGWLVFNTIPDNLTLLGMGIVAASGLMIAFKSRR